MENDAPNFLKNNTAGGIQKLQKSVKNEVLSLTGKLLVFIQNTCSAINVTFLTISKNIVFGFLMFLFRIKLY